MNNLFQSLEVTHRLDTIIFSFRSIHFKHKPVNFLWYELVPPWCAYLYVGLFAAGSALLFKLRQLPDIMSLVQHPGTCQQQWWLLQPGDTEGAVRNAFQWVWHQEPVCPLAPSSRGQPTRGGTEYQQRAVGEGFAKVGGSRENKTADGRIICQQRRWQTGALFPVPRKATAKVEVKSYL